MSDAEEPLKIERLTRGDRGFVGYGEPVHCTYGTAIEVYESSSAEGPHIWLALRQDLRVLRNFAAGEAHAHLSAEQARLVIARLQAFLDDIPERWGQEDAGV